MALSSPLLGTNRRRAPVARVARGARVELIALAPLLLLLLLLLAPALPLRAQQAEPPRTAEELHAARRMWLERQRLGDSAAVWTPAYRGARGPVPAGAGGEAAGGGGAGGVGGAGGAVGPGGAGVPLPPRYGAPLPGYHPPPVYAPPAVHGAYAPPGAPGAPGAPPWDPAYPPVNRFHSRFFPQEPWSVPPAYGSELHVVPPHPWRPQPWYWGLSPWGCALVSVAGLSGSITLQVALPVLGATTPEELELVIDARLTSRQVVALQSLDGRVLRIAPGAEVRLVVRTCAAP